MEKIMKKLVHLAATINEDPSKGPITWWFREGDLMVEVLEPLPFNVTAAELQEVATTSCGPQIWFLRAIARRWAIRIPTIDWWWWNVK